MGISVELDWDSVDDVTVKNLYDHYRIVCAMIENDDWSADLEYNTKLKDSLVIVLEHFGMEF